METNSTPWKSILTTRGVWAIFAGEFGNCWSFYLILTYLTKYLENIHDLTLIQTAFHSSTPWLMLIFGIAIAEPLCEIFIKNGKISKINARRLYIFLGNISSAICIVLASYMGTPKWSFVMIHMTMFFKSYAFAGLKLNVLDHTKCYAMNCIAFYTMGGIVIAIIVPFLTGFMTPNVKQ